MNFISNYLLILYLTGIFIQSNYKYTLIITGKNCYPCIVSADAFLAKNKINYKLINLYNEKAEKDFSEEAIKHYCKDSKYSKYISVKGKYVFGKYIFHSDDGGPILIKYSKRDTLIYNPLNIDTVTIEDKHK
ncbi:MAG: hypothetical protein HY062_11555 [Bacteroidetes bacterium]|nr:hypothetical protein [Bacteroidota bacterium]